MIRTSSSSPVGNDLHEVDPALGEVLSEVAAAHVAQSDRRRIKRRQRTHVDHSVADSADGTSTPVQAICPPRPLLSRSMPDLPQSVRVANAELATIREAMRELHRLLDQLEHGDLDKIVLTQRNQMRAVLLTLDRYVELERNAA